MEIMDIKFTIGRDEDWDEEFQFLSWNTYDDFTLSQKLKMLKVLRNGIIDQEIEKLLETIEELPQLGFKGSDLDEVIKLQTKILKELKNERK